MISLWRGNSYTEIRGISSDLLRAIGRHLAVPVNPDQVKVGGYRYHHIFYEPLPNGEGGFEPWGSLLYNNRVPAGLTEHVEALLRHYEVPFELRDIRVAPEQRLPLWSVQGTGWYPYQDAVHAAITREGTGVIESAPRSGKTSMCMRAIDSLGQPALVVAPSVAIVKQTYEVFRKVFGVDMVARVDGTATEAERDISKHIVIATTASAIRLPLEFFKTRGILALDEFHHDASESGHVLNALSESIYHRLCFTGTYFRSGADQLALEAVCSKVIYKIPVGYLVQGGWLAPPRIVVAETRSPRFDNVWGYQNIYDKGIVNNEHRNRLVAYTAKKLAHDLGIPTIVLVRRRPHADLLGELIPDSVVVKGGENALTSKAIERFRAGRIPVLIGTTVIGEGVDLPNAGALVYASGGSASVQQIQSYYRPLTAYPGKAQGIIYDFHDKHHRTLSSQSDRRFEFAAKNLDTEIVRL